MSRDDDPREAIVTHLPALRAFALSLTHNPALADDIVHETVVKAWTHFDKFREGSNLRAWLFTILRNQFYTERRRARREVPDINNSFALHLAEKPAHDGRLQMRDFMAAFATLPVEQREVLILVGASGFSYAEAAEMCGIAVGTAKSRANRGRARLAELLGLDEDGATELTDRAVYAVVSAARASAFV